MKNILVTGGAGYIGSHICLKLLENDYRPIVLDNLANGHRDAVPEGAEFVRGDIRDRSKIEDTFSTYRPAAVIHLAGLIEAGQSMKTPGEFYDNNVNGSQVLFSAMLKYDCKSIVFSSTAAVYGACERELIDEEQPVFPCNPYGHSKAMVETILRDYSSIHGFQAIALRYFNAAGADPYKRAGERHTPETHLIPRALLAAKNGGVMRVFGTDYPTPDGTCVRDYVHVDDISWAHIDALTHVLSRHDQELECINLGTERGYSVLEVLNICQKVTGINFGIEYLDRRPGDPAKLVASAQKAKRLLSWTPRFENLETLVQHAWNFTRFN
jgi:UDP-glucose 4-epimerase/UDP-arabinose 4-epimerase